MHERKYGDMKVLIVYYSRSGKTRNIAELIHSKLNSDLEQVTDNKNRGGIFGFFVSGNEAYLKKKIHIDNLKYEPENYELIIVGTPIWAGNISSPIRSFLLEYQNKIKEVAFFCTSMGSDPKTASGEIKKITGQEAIAILNITSRDLKNKFFIEMVDGFVDGIKRFLNEEERQKND